MVNRKTDLLSAVLNMLALSIVFLVISIIVITFSLFPTFEFCIGLLKTQATTITIKSTEATKKNFYCFKTG